MHGGPQALRTCRRPALVGILLAMPAIMQAIATHPNIDWGQRHRPRPFFALGFYKRMSDSTGYALYCNKRAVSAQKGRKALTGTAIAKLTRKQTAVFLRQCLGSANQPPAGDQIPAQQSVESCILESVLVSGPQAELQTFLTAAFEPSSRQTTQGRGISVS